MPTLQERQQTTDLHLFFDTGDKARQNRYLHAIICWCKGIHAFGVWDLGGKAVEAKHGRYVWGKLTDDDVDDDGQSE